MRRVISNKELSFRVQVEFFFNHPLVGFLVRAKALSDFETTQFVPSDSAGDVALCVSDVLGGVARCNRHHDK